MFWQSSFSGLDVSGYRVEIERKVTNEIVEGDLIK